MTEVKDHLRLNPRAETALRGGRAQYRQPPRQARRILFWYYLIAKWRNLTMHERNALHGELLMHSDLDW
ncbi:hypothetical protein [Roseicitreum antarcticum]|uniref:hypothetical protein n=1 Tax=Roseicitreum antarcticum TaxID=564137 RepID=UPI00167FED14|nr:hypothetical protein [Roseicitreum antarcticum]